MPNPPSASSASTALADLIVRGKRVITPEAERAAAIHIRAGTIVAITPFDDIAPGIPLHEVGDAVVMPGIVDTHVHINEPGRTEWEGFSTATRAAAAGGVTSLIEMPLNSIPATTTASAYREKLAAAAGKLSVDVGFWGGVVPGNIGELRPLWDAGVFGFKCFLVPSGVDEFASANESDLRAALPELAAMGAPLLAHAELPGPIEDATAKLPKGASPKRYATWLAARPHGAEDEAIALLVRLAREYKARVHVVHLVSSDSLAQLRQARAEGLAISVETCPHYLSFAAEDVPDGATEFKCAPPLRLRENLEKLWAALGDGSIDFIATDHSPCPPPLKLPDEGDFLRAWGGISSLQLSLPAVWTQARSRGYSVSRLAGWLGAGPARLAGIEARKGAIAVGRDADLVIWNPEATFRVDAARLHHRHKVTPYAGQEMAGVVETTFLRGRKIFERGEFTSLPAGQVLRRGAS
ncbi:MAG TPA: allantoinase AllB [Candidatus Acidoferrales bacterium]|jgi:allantoinase|nr:allantoinase AllB [Candidatus Acidoferrales bacterium]